jgi:hypothetical protein
VAGSITPNPAAQESPKQSPYISVDAQTRKDIDRGQFTFQFFYVNIMI